MHHASRSRFDKSQRVWLPSVLLIFQLCSSSVEGQSLDLKSGLEVYWTFDEGAGDVAKDISGKARDAAVFNVPAFQGLSILWTEGKFGKAINFDGSYFLAVSNYFGIGGLTPRTVSLWIMTDWIVPSGATAIMGWGPNTAQRRWHFKLEASNNGALRTENQSGNNWGAIPVNDGPWHHIASNPFAIPAVNAAFYRVIVR